jgi:hypothetical protein
MYSNTERWLSVCVDWIWTQDSCLPIKCTTSWDTPSPFLSWLLWRWSLTFCPSLFWTMTSYFTLPSVVGMTNLCHHTQLFSIEMRYQELFLPGLTWNHNPPDLSFLSNLELQVNTTVPSYWLRWGLLCFPKLASNLDPSDVGRKMLYDVILLCILFWNLPFFT